MIHGLGDRRLDGGNQCAQLTDSLFKARNDTDQFRLRKSGGPASAVFVECGHQLAVVVY